MSDYAWVITKDHLADAGETGDAGVCGPHDAPDALLDAVKAGKGRVFYLYDDDAERYYTGRLITTAGDPVTEDHCYAPLGDFGMGWAGCTYVRWHGHPEWDCE